ncbi:unnamed protein product [Lactuca virosa]|uniref:Uncharacterized protein n=1 Tax=Lactuca virosa TaxID=75947 RepID=A0AAU9MZR1_9ASTR|nr:unnamed protein product [Lactuca virosa]
MSQFLFFFHNCNFSMVRRLDRVRMSDTIASSNRQFPELTRHSRAMFEETISRVLLLRSFGFERPRSNWDNWSGARDNIILQQELPGSYRIKFLKSATWEHEKAHQCVVCWRC